MLVRVTTPHTHSPHTAPTANNPTNQSTTQQPTQPNQPNSPTAQQPNQPNSSPTYGSPTAQQSNSPTAQPRGHTFSEGITPWRNSQQPTAQQCLLVFCVPQKPATIHQPSTTTHQTNKSPTTSHFQPQHQLQHYKLTMSTNPQCQPTAPRHNMTRHDTTQHDEQEEVQSVQQENCSKQANTPPTHHRPTDRPTDRPTE